MASITFNLTNLTRGNDVTLKFNITTSVDLASARLVAKKKAKDLDTALVINKLITTSLSGDGQITDPGGADKLAVAQFFLTKAETATFLPDVDYQWDLEVFDAGGKSTTPAGGTITFEERVRIATG